MGKVIYDAKTDKEYSRPYIDKDETQVRRRQDGKEVSYRYMHGGFEGTNVRFTLHFPEKESFQGRFFHYLSPFPGPEEEVASMDKSGTDDRILFALEHGAYFVESNMGSKVMFGPNGDDTTRWKSSAAVAEYSREKAMEIYGCNRPVGIVYGGSGGGYKTMACIENTNAWEGAVPYVIGSPVSLPNTITMHVQGQRVLRNAFSRIVENLDAGGSGNAYDGLAEEEKQMLLELTNMGFPPQAWYLEAAGNIDPGSLPVLTPGMKRSDPEYFSDFWSKPGYMGADPESTASRDRLRFKGVVKSVHVPGKKDAAEKELEGRNGVDDAWKKMLTDGNGAWIELETLPEGENLYLKGVTITVESGDAKGRQMLLGDMVKDAEASGGFLTIGMCYGMDDLSLVLSSLKAGDEVSLDNSDYIAAQSYYRHQVPKDLDFHAWDQFRDTDGNPVLPQREKEMGYGFTGTGTVQDGNIQGKVMVVQALMDESTCPWCGDWYRETVRKAKGNEDAFRLYYNQRCMHGDLAFCINNMVVNYQGVLYQALLDMADWIQTGAEPLKTTVYKRDGGQIIEEPDPAKRCGLQPGIRLTVNGEKCAKVKAGETFTLEVVCTVPENAGEVTGVWYDFLDRWDYPAPEGLFPVEGAFERTETDGVHGALSKIQHSFDKPGVYYVSALVTSNRKGDGADAFTQMKNLDRAKIVVE